MPSPPDEDIESYNRVFFGKLIFCGIATKPYYEGSLRTTVVEVVLAIEAGAVNAVTSN